jgi:hypothetical protein
MRTPLFTAALILAQLGAYSRAAESEVAAYVRAGKLTPHLELVHTNFKERSYFMLELQLVNEGSETLPGWELRRSNAVVFVFSKVDGEKRTVLHEGQYNLLPRLLHPPPPRTDGRVIKDAPVPPLGPGDAAVAGLQFETQLRGEVKADQEFLPFDESHRYQMKESGTYRFDVKLVTDNIPLGSCTFEFEKAKTKMGIVRDLRVRLK